MNALLQAMKLTPLGKTIIERQNDGEILIMFPDGGIEGAASPKEAQRKAIAWSNRHTEAAAVTQLEWRKFKPEEVPQ